MTPHKDQTRKGAVLKAVRILLQESAKYGIKGLSSSTENGT